jgi:hypothetical protein
MIILFLLAGFLMILSTVAARKGTALGYADAQTDVLTAIFCMMIVRFVQAAIYRRISKD